MSTTLSVSELLLRPIVFTRPIRLVDPTSWVPHIPFAFWLVDALRPRTIVELGTHSGNSFSAFAQAVQVLGLESACYAVDTWKGDEHSGFYGDAVFEEWSAFHDPHFGAFSRLVRSTFDDALTKFGDGSIDLLHIDGYHTYEAVRHDFESWLPKLSASAVVLLHDTNVRERDFGVWKFWQDLSHQYPCFAFLHGHGLGVVGVGRSLPADVRVLLEHAPDQSQHAFAIRQFFGTLGEALLRQPREATQARVEATLRSELSSNMETLLSERERFAAWLTERDQQLDAARAEISRVMATLTTERERFTGWLTERDQALDLARVQISQLAAANEEMSRVQERVELQEAKITAQEAALARLDAERGRSDKAFNAKVEAQEAELARLNADRSRSDEALKRQEEARHIERADLQARLKARKAEVTQLRAKRHQLAKALQSREKESNELRGAVDRYRATVGKFEQDAARWFKLVLRLRGSRAHRAARALRGTVTLAREMARRARFWRPLPAEATPMLASMHPATRKRAEAIRRSGIFDDLFYMRRYPQAVETSLSPVMHFVILGARKGRQPHPLFDVRWYLEQAGAKAKSNPLLDYLEHGVRKKRSPNRLFDVPFYLAQHSDAAGAEPLAHYLAVGAAKGSNPHPLFDTKFYLERNPRVAAKGRNPLEHYLTSGGMEGCDPHPLFRSAFYLSENPGVRAAGENPLVHFLRVGAAEGRAPAPGQLFDSRWYIEQAGAKAKSNPLLHYLEHGVRKRRSPNRLFDVSFYLKQHQKVAAAGYEPLSHYLIAGAAAGSNPHPLFDTRFYLERNRKVAAAGQNPLEHYLTSGALEGRDPHPLFDTAFYLDQNPELRTTKENPLIHFLTVGAAEGRDPNPWFDTSFYVDADPQVRESGENPLVHFLRVGAAEGRPAGPAFDTAYYVRTYPDVAASGLNPLTHFVLSGKAERRRTCAPPASTSGASGIQVSLDAYETLARRAREIEASRIATLVISPPALIQLSREADLSSHARDVVLRAEESPLVSIVIPVFNNIRLTLECLLSIVEGGSEVPFEVIVVDNASTDATREVLPTIPNLVFMSNAENTGFGPGCNKGAEAARGRYLVFLNNDAQVKSGWLTALLGAFSEFEHVGAVGPRVIFPDGRLQDAGSLVNPDCTTSLIGVFDDPDLPRFNYPREVEYVSGVCFMIEAERFREIRGFDNDFAPAYCEDVDLCLRLRQKGLRIVYQPSATIVHHLSATSNALDPSFKVAAITRNQQKLSSRHQAQIDDLARARVIAFYLPQFHPIPENDAWWGKGFTEWRNVTRARPNFEGHVQPRLAGDLGYYDLRLRDTYVEQVALAERYGVSGFCFYYYWFEGKRLLERPLERLLEDETLRFPFCVCWANENWTRRWDGREHEVLIAQSYSEEDDVSVIQDLIRYLRHPSYIRINERPLLLIYHASRFPDMRRTIETWRAECRSHGIGEIYLAMVQTFDLPHASVTPIDLGFDAAVEFPPHQAGVSPVQPDRVVNPRFKGHVFDYPGTALHYMTQKPPGYRRFRTVMPGWDNTARRQDDSIIFSGSTPGAYQAWLEWVLRQTREQHFGDERLVFVNAWNEWAEGAYLEPDLGWGHAYLEATRDAQNNQQLAPLVFVNARNDWGGGAHLETDRRHGYAYLEATADALEQFPARGNRPSIVCVSHDAYFHGAQLIALHLARTLSSRFHYEVQTILCGPGPLTSEFEAVSRVHDFARPGRTRDDKLAVARRLYDHGARVAICNTSVIGETAELLKEAGFSVISLIHELPVLMRAYQLDSSIRRIADHAHRVVFPARVVRDSFASLTGLASDRTVVLPQGLFAPNEFFGRRAMARHELRSQLGLSRTAQIVLAVGYADHRKGFDLFVEVGVAVARQASDVVFVWVGNHEESIFAAGRARIREAGLEARFVFPGAVRNSAMFFAGADTYVMTSREDPFPSVVVEALDASLPVIGFEGAGGFVELLERGCGVLVPFEDTMAMADSVLRILRSPDEGERLTSAARGILATEFSFVNYARSLVELAEGPRPRVSVIVPNYNYARYLPQRLQSIIDQTYPPHEVLFLDDCSTDDSVEIAEQMLHASGLSYRIVANETNQGTYRQWLRGIREAKGDLVWIAEADDDCAPNLLESLVGQFNTRDVVLAYCQSRQIDETGNELAPDYLAWTADISDTKWRERYIRSGVQEISDTLAVKNTIPNVSAVLMRRIDLAAIERKLVSFRNAGDWFLYVHLLEQGSIAFVPDALNSHRRHGSSVTIGGNALNLMREILMVQQYVVQRHGITPDTEKKREADLQRTYEYLGLNVRGPAMYKDHESLREVLMQTLRP